ncbi:MAG: 1-deoxy-D-xylulose-5-phosphate reductoisomerase [Zoogloeaceae bacterium]|jgi:1-deoxy-D-xylulose-5-phosphate reductoisomerase|nr:1-deoxy-D-xylulose-5-phosphate reductoisomerase [Zoogloeaceae bacterium]
MSCKPRRLVILGATGSIGGSTLAVARLHPERYQIWALTARRQVEKLAALCREFRPCYAALADAEDAAELAAKLRASQIKTEVLYGADAFCQLAAASEADTVMAAIVGAAGLAPALAAARAGKRLLLANKEALVMAGGLFMRAVRDNKTTLLPIDSEHNAIFQSLPRDFAPLGDAKAWARSGVRQLWLTASGGPFLRFSARELENVTPEAAISHPNWSMGAKISVDSASLMNKGLEVIEAHWLFAAPPDCLRVAVHPQSIVHSLVEYQDGSFLAQLGAPDMRVPIAHALAYPERFSSGARTLDLFARTRLDFMPPDTERFPCLRLAYDALKTGGSAPATLNAANEIAVDAFLRRRLSFPGIAHLVEEVLAAMPAVSADTLESVEEADRAARETAHSLLSCSAVL